MSLDHFKTKLDTEKTKLEGELNDLGRKDPDNPSHWEAVPSDRSGEPDFRDETADRFEEFDERESTKIALESRLAEVTAALGRLEANTYGICSVCQAPIEEDRLEANPAATTCKAHMDEGENA